MRRLLAFVIVLTGALSGAASADVVPQRRWLQVRSQHFTVMGEVGAGELRRVAERMEQLHELLTTTTGMPNLEVRDVTVVVFKDRRSFEPYMPRHEGKAVDVAGYFQSGPMNFISILADARADYSDTVYHEYVHLATSRALGALPIWMSEGFAEFYSTFDPSGGRTVSIGHPKGRHIARLQTEFLPLATLTSIERDSPYYNERDKMSVFYAEAWAFTHFLQIGNGRKYLPKLQGFYHAVLAGAPFERAAAEQLGTPVATLEKELRQYLDRLFFYQLNVALSERLGRVERLEATTVGEADAHAVLAQLLLGQDDEEQAQAHLEHALKADAQHPMALALLAHAAAERGKSEETRSLVARAAAAPRGTYLSAYYRARALEEIAETSDAAREQLEAAWRAVLADNPYSSEASGRLAQLRADAAAFAEARQLQEQAIRLAPARQDYVLGLARILILSGDTKAARSVLGPLAARAKTPEVVRVAREYLAIAARIELAGADAAIPVPEAPDVPEPNMPTTGGEPAATAPSETRRRTEPDPGFVPILRDTLEGETRVFGTLTAIECSNDGSVIVAATPAGPLRVRGETLDRVDFVSFRSDVGGAITCGSQGQSLPVLVTYRPDPDGKTDGEIVIVEVVPAGYKPRL